MRNFRAILVTAVLAATTLVAPQAQAAPAPTTVAAQNSGQVKIWEHHGPGGRTLQTQYLYFGDCDTIGYRWNAVDPGGSSNIQFVPQASGTSCNSVWARSRGGTIMSWCVGWANPTNNFPAFLNDNLRDFGVQHRSSCPRAW